MTSIKLSAIRKKERSSGRRVSRLRPGAAAAVAGMLIAAACSGSSSEPESRSSVDPTAAEVSSATTTPPIGTAADADTSSTTTTSTTATTTTTTTTTTVPPAPVPDLPGLVDASDRAIVADPLWRTGELDNGLTYYVRYNDRPLERTTLRLAIRAGAVDEFGPSAGVAHFTEHMLFNGTERFPENELVAVLRGFGAEFGADVNAYTSYDETVYELAVPTEPGPIELGVEVLAEWLDRATFAPAEVEAERGVVADEWRVRTQSAGGRVFDQKVEMLLGGTEYDGRLPIGDVESIEGVTRDELVEYYDSYYRVDNAAVVMVGDFDVDTMASWIEQHFGSITAPDSPLREPPPSSDETDTTPDAVTHPDVDLETASVEVALPLPTHDGTGTARKRIGIIDALVFDVLRERLERDVLAGAAPFFDVGWTTNAYTDEFDAYSIFVDADPGDSEAALIAVLDEFERAVRHGFDTTEVAVAVDRERSHRQSEFEQRESRRDESFADDAVANFLTGAAMPNVTNDFSAARQILDDITPEALHERLLARWGHSAPHVVVSGPTGATLPTRDRALELVDGLGARELVTRDALPELPDSLMAAPEPTAPSSTERFDENDSRYTRTVWTFPNGITLIAARNFNITGEVFLQGTSSGGTSLIPDEDLPDSRYATRVVESSGVGEFDQSELDRMLAGTSAWIDASTGPYYDTMWSAASLPDIETMFQLVHLYMNEPNVDEVALDRVLREERPVIEDPSGEPQRAANDALADLRYGDDIRYTTTMSLDDFESVDLEGIERVWRDRFEPAEDWVFVVNGDVDFDQVRDLGARYLGSLSTREADEPSPNVTAAPPAGVATETVRAGDGETASVQIRFTSPVDDVTGTLRANTAVANDLLDTRLTNVIREELGDTYSPWVSMSFLVDPDPTVVTTVNVTAAPDRIDEVADLAIAQIADIAENGPTDAEMVASLAVSERNYDWKNSWDIIEEISADRLKPTMDLDDYVLADRDYPSWDVGPDSIRSFFQTHLPTDQYVRVDLLPR